MILTQKRKVRGKACVDRGATGKPDAKEPPHRTPSENHLREEAEGPYH